MSGVESKLPSYRMLKVSIHERYIYIREIRLVPLSSKVDIRDIDSISFL